MLVDATIIDAVISTGVHPPVVRMYEPLYVMSNSIVLVIKVFMIEIIYDKKNVSH